MTVASPPALPADIVDAFATHVARTRYEHLPPLAVAKAKTFMPMRRGDQPQWFREHSSATTAI